MRSLFLCLLAMGVLARGTATGGEVVLRNVQIVDVETGTCGEATDILVEDGRIAALGDAKPSGEPEAEIDCTGKYALPGLFDCHTHLAHLTDHGEDSLKIQLEAFVTSGVMLVRDVGGPIDMLSEMKRKISSGELIGPEIFYTGPMLESSPLTWAKQNETKPGFTVAIDSPADVDSLLPELARRGAPIIKTFNRIPMDLYRHVVEVANENTLKIVHDPGTPLFHWVPMDEAIDLGVTSIEHAKAPWPVALIDELRAEHDKLIGPDVNEMMRMGFMTKVCERGVESVSMERVEWLAEKMRDHGAYLCPTLSALLSSDDEIIESVREMEGLDEIPDPMRVMILKMTHAMQDVSRLFVRELAVRGVHMLVGHDGCDPSGAIEEMGHLSDCGVSAAEIIRGATIYPAEWLGVDDRVGSIAVGKQANILVVDGNPIEEITRIASPFLVMQNGRVVSR